MGQEKNRVIAEDLIAALSRRLAIGSGACPLEYGAAFLRASHSQSCGKCVPCRIGIGQLQRILDKILDGNGEMSDIALMEQTAKTISESADCAIGYQAGNIVLNMLKNYKADVISHITTGGCLHSNVDRGIPCVEGCPAHVDVPGYIALIKDGRYNEAVELIRQDNPFVMTCAYICEHPCENYCRRQLIDDALNIRALKQFAVEHAENVAPSAKAEPTGKKIAVIGGGPSGMTCAYYAALMGHSVTVYEQYSQLGGMLRYGIPSYRFPREKLNEELEGLLASGIEVKYNTTVGKDITYEELTKQYDKIYLSIGSHVGKKMGIDGEENNPNVLSAVELLKNIGNDVYPDFSGKIVNIVGGGNVAMDVARTALRAKAKKVNIIYRRRREDMTALPNEIEGAVAEGCELITMYAPKAVEVDENGNVVGVRVERQIAGAIDASGRPKPVGSGDEEVIACDVIIGAIGQDIDSAHFAQAGIATKRNRILTGAFGWINDQLYAGGDCVTGPASAIKAIAAGKEAAVAIDKALGYAHDWHRVIDIPQAASDVFAAHGRNNSKERFSEERKEDFRCIEYPMSAEEAMQESKRCLRCDHYGKGCIKPMQGRRY